MSPSPHLPADALVAHAGFLRALGHSLLRGDDRVEDAVQDTYLAALDGGPSQPGRERGWLASVLRRRIARLRRADVRLDRARRAAPAAEPVQAVDAAAERRELIGRLTSALLALPEPYREALVLRYYEALPPSRLAARLGVPVETARTRVKRGLERLRATLDAEHADGRRAWTGALAGMLGKPRPALPLALSAAVLGVGGALGLWWLGVFDPVERALPGRAPAALATAGPPLLQGSAPPDAPPRPAAPPAPPGAPPPGSPSPEAPSADPSVPLPRSPSPDHRRSVFGRVTDINGRPVAGARLEAWTTASNDLAPGPMPFGPDPDAAARLAAADADAQGRYALGPLPPGPVDVRVRAEGFAWQQGLLTRPGRNLDLVLEPGGSLAVRVLGADGSPVAATVRAVPRDGQPRPALAAPAGTEARFEGLPLGPVVLAAGVEGAPRTTVRVQVEPGSATRLEMRLRARRPVRLVGRARTREGTPVSDAEARWGYEGAVGPTTQTDAEGRFAFEVDAGAEGAGTLTVDGGKRGWWQQTYDLGQGRPLWSPQQPPELFPGEAPTFRMGWKPLPEGEIVATLHARPAGLGETPLAEGRVVDGAGQPVPGAQARRSTGERATADAQGRFRLGARRQGDLIWFQARGPDGALGVRMAPVEGEAAVVDIPLVPVVRVCVTVRAPGGAPVEGALVVLRRNGNLEMRAGLPPEEQVANLCRHDPDAAGLVATTDARGEACLLAPSGGYAAEARAPGLRAAPAGIDVQPGSGLTLTLAPTRLVRGTVRDAGGRAVAGARLRAFTQQAGYPNEAWSRADGTFSIHDAPEGAFRIRAQRALDPWVLLDVSADAGELDVRLP